MMKTLCILVFCCLSVVGFGGFQESSNSQQDKETTQVPVDQLVEHINKNGQPPIEYVVQKFESADIVLLGEIHLVRETCEFVASLIEPLNKAGVKRLGFEFIPTRLNDRLKTIVTAKEYDEEGVIQIFRLGASPTWGYREYMDIVRAAWKANQQLGEDEPPFLIIGIDSDWKQVELFEASERERFRIIMDREKNMTDVIRKVAIEDKQKTLVYIGHAHTVRHGIRLANELAKDHSDRMFQIMMHHRMKTPSGVSTFSESVELAVKKSNRTRCGFDVVSSPFAKLEDDKIPFINAIGKEPTMDKIAEGCVFLKPAEQHSNVTWVKGYINETNFADALDLAKRGRWLKQDPKTPAELDALFAERYPSDPDR